MLLHAFVFTADFAHALMLRCLLRLPPRLPPRLMLRLIRRSPAASPAPPSFYFFKMSYAAMLARYAAVCHIDMPRAAMLPAPCRRCRAIALRLRPCRYAPFAALRFSMRRLMR